MTTFGNWLRTNLNRAGLSNAELGRRVGVSGTYIGNLIRDYSQNTKSGRVRPSEEVVESIAKALGTDVDEARLAAGYAAKHGGKIADEISRRISIAMQGKDFSEQDQAEILEEADLAINLILARRRARQEKSNGG